MNTGSDTLADRFEGVRGWLTEVEAAALTEIAKGKTVLEIGSWCGRSTIAMSKVAFRVYALDWHRGDAIAGFGDTLEEFWLNLGKAGAMNVVPLVGRTEQFERVLGSSWADVVFIDGAHDEGSVVSDCRLALRCLKPGGTVALHDWDRPQVQRAFFKVFGQQIGVQSDVTYIAKNIQKKETESMSNSITRTELEIDRAGLVQQAEECLKAKREAENRYEAVHGAIQAVDTLLNRIKEKDAAIAAVQVAVDNVATECAQDATTPTAG